MGRLKLPRPKGYENHVLPYTREKPWGHEKWLELIEDSKGRGYCFKEICLKKGERSSFQYHEKKIETQYIIDGKAEIWLENGEGEIEKKIMKRGDSYTIVPPTKHRVIALTDILLFEVSTPEIDDVIRVEDDFGREKEY